MGSKWVQQLNARREEAFQQEQARLKAKADGPVDERSEDQKALDAAMQTWADEGGAVDLLSGDEAELEVELTLTHGLQSSLPPHLQSPDQYMASQGGGFAEWLKRENEDEQYAGGGVREAKPLAPRFELLVPEGVPYNNQLLTRFAIHMAKGATKYEQRNWEKFEDQAALDRAKAGALRHIYQWLTDEQDGEDHAAAVMFNLMAAEHIKWKQQVRGEMPEDYCPECETAPGECEPGTCPGRNAPQNERPW